MLNHSTLYMHISCPNGKQLKVNFNTKLALCKDLTPPKPTTSTCTTNDRIPLASKFSIASFLCCLSFGDSRQSIAFLQVSLGNPVLYTYTIIHTTNAMVTIQAQYTQSIRTVHVLLEVYNIMTSIIMQTTSI